MILIAIELNDFKQFRGPHVFTPSADGIVAVVGANGSGKSTLFEAIEWCLYQPRSINLEEIAPRGASGQPRVTVTLEELRTGQRFVIERLIERRTQGWAARASVRLDDQIEPLVHGSTQVTDYVARRLIGLNHRAFVSTFFTRQKELTFFGDMNVTERRREVGRLLGMETIREAQKLIGEERADLQSQTRSLEIQHQESIAGRDFTAEIEDVEQLLAEHVAAVEAATLALAQAERVHLDTRVELERLTAIERSDSTLRTELERVQGDIRAAEAQRDASRAELGRIDAAEQERNRLQPIASQLDPRRLELQSQELARERFQTRSQIEASLLRVRTNRSEAVGELRRTVSATPGDGLPGWSWSAGDDADPVTAVGRLIATVSSLDVAAASTRVDSLERCARLAAERDQFESSLQKMRHLLDRLNAELAEKSVAGDPRLLRERLGRDREQALRHVHESGVRTKAIDEELARLEPVQSRLRAQEEGTICPSCGRPIHADDIAVTLSVFAERIGSLEAERIDLTRQRPAWLERAAELETEIVAAAERASELDVLRGRIDSGIQKIADAEQELEQKSAALVSALQNLGLVSPPSNAELEQAAQRLESLRRLAGTAPLLARIETSLRQAVTDEADLSGELAKIGEVAYDPTTHASARTALSEAEHSSARIGQIDMLLAQRPDRQQELGLALQRITLLQVSREELIVRLAEVAFEPATLERSRLAEQQALIAERQSRDQRAKAEANQIDGSRILEALINERDRATRLIERSEAKAREASELDRMYREFNAFEQFAADQLTPRLSEYTSETLRAITDGKYDRVEFNSDYGIEIYDGDDEKFPVEEFSGGERDVIALCARLALSRLIGSQANNPPGFLVLDEVFGSLDRERRAQVLEILGGLAGTADAFHQLFIISHVDDVRSSPIFNEVWRVSEGLDGISHLENLNLTGGFDDA